MDKTILRDKLFQKYFQVDNGVNLKDLLDKLKFIPDTYSILLDLCKKSVRGFDSFSSLNSFKMINYNQKRYLVLEVRMWRYIIIDIDELKCISQIEFERDFDLDFFTNNFDNCDDDIFPCIYRLDKYNGDLKELISFYNKNQEVFNLPSQLYYKLSENDSWTWVQVDFINQNIQMGFQTPDQLLYEQLFLNYDLTPYGIQDAVQKMGIDKMNEIFSMMNDVKIPIESIPNDLYQQYLNCLNSKLTLKSLFKNLL